MELQWVKMTFAKAVISKLTISINAYGRLTTAGKYSSKWEKGKVFMLILPQKENYSAKFTPYHVYKMRSRDF